MPQVPVGSYRAPRSLSRSDHTPTNLSRSGASTRSGISVHSAGTGNSRASRWSIDSADTVNSVHSLQSLANQISADLYPQERLVSQLRDWQRTLNPATYRRQVPWPPEVKAAYDEYKRLVHVFAQAREAFDVDKRQTATMPEQHLERARLAVAWGEAALRAAEGRLTFLDTYRNAYSGPQSIKTHIQEGQNTINSGRRAVKEARTNYEKLWEKYNRQTDPRVFA
ncbi:hypothetical protein HFD88_000534 [Aspergillus terreus]|nr:hypothetical protein HFD88_000534 [Aspergillus terreus]